MVRAVRGLALAMAVAVGGILAAGPTAALARPAGAGIPVSGTTASLLWQRACEAAAKGSISPQPALVCMHLGLPQWRAGSLHVLETICTGPLGGTFVYRSEFPVELAACFTA